VSLSLEVGRLEPPATAPAPSGPGALGRQLRDALPQLEEVLTPRQMGVLCATLSASTQKAAAVAAGMAAVDFRRAQRATAAKIRKIFDAPDEPVGRPSLRIPDRRPPVSPAARSQWASVASERGSALTWA